MTASHRHPGNRSVTTGANNKPKMPAWKDREPRHDIQGTGRGATGHTLAETRRINKRARELAAKPKRRLLIVRKEAQPLNGNDPCPKCGDVMAVHGDYAGAEVRCDFRDESDLTPQLIGLEGWRVEIRDEETSLPRRFYVGRSTGWKPCHLEIHNRRSLGGGPAAKEYASIRKLYKR